MGRKGVFYLFKWRPTFATPWGMGGGSRHHVQFCTCIPYLQYMINELSSPQVNRSGQTTKMSLTLYTLLIVWRMTFVLTKKKKRDESRGGSECWLELTVHCRILCETVTVYIGSDLAFNFFKLLWEPAPNVHLFQRLASLLTSVLSRQVFPPLQFPGGKYHGSRKRGERGRHA